MLPVREVLVRFRKKSVVIEAWLFTGEEGAVWPLWMETYRHDQGRLAIVFQRRDGDGKLIGLGIPTLEGWMSASPGDWIIRGVKGEIYPCKPDIFEATHEPAELEKA